MLPTLGTRITEPTPRAGLTRRQLFVRGALLTGGLVVAGVLVRVAQLLGEGAAPGRKVVSTREERTIVALIEAMLPGEVSLADGEAAPASGELMPPGDVVFILGYLDDFLAGSDPDVRLLFKSTVQLVEEQARLTQLAPFSSLSLAARQAEVRAWEQTPTYLKRSAFQSVKAVIAMAYFEQPEAAQAVGWYVGCAPPHLIHKSQARLHKGTS